MNHNALLFDTLTDEEIALTPENFWDDNELLLEKKKYIEEHGIDTAILSFLWVDKVDGFLDKECTLFLTNLSGAYMTEWYLYREKILLCFMHVGAPLAAMTMERLAWLGIKNFLACGSAGAISSELDTEKVFVVEDAIRDEGTSFHYLAPSLTVELDKHMIKKIEEALANENIEYEKGRIWTTDAIFRETKKRIAQRIFEGAKAVDMECSAWASIAKRKGLRFGELCFFSDVTHQDGWRLATKRDKFDNFQVHVLKVCLKVAEQLTSPST